MAQVERYALIHSASMHVPLLNMRAAGNRILVADARGLDGEPPADPELRELAHEHGFDQLMWVTTATDPGDTAAYRVFNADGSEVEQCGNGVRCVVRILAADFGREFTLDSPAGPVAVRALEGGLVSVDMGRPEFEASRLDVNGQSLDVSLVSMGNPHCVLLVDDVASARVDTLGPLIEHHDRFPDRINVGFMHVRDRDNVDLRVHERGVGETLACGTGACAAVVAGRELGLLNDAVNVFLPGGKLVVSWRGGADTVWLTGDAEILSEGFIDL